MSKLKSELAAMEKQYQALRYPGNLAADIGLFRSRRRWWLGSLSAVAALIVLAFIFQPRHEPAEITKPVAITTPAPATVEPQADNTSASESVADASDTEAESVELTQLSSSVSSLSFSNITDWPSVSASVPALGGFSSLEWNTQEVQTPTTQESAS